MTNSTIVASLVADPVPPNRECISNGSDVLSLCVDFLKVSGLVSGAGGGSLPATNSLSQQALETAQSALALAQTLQAQIGQTRSSGISQSLDVGDSTVAITWAPSMPDTNYRVDVTIGGTGSHPSAYYGWRVIDSSKTVSGVQISFDNIPANSTYSWTVTQLT